MNAIASMQPNFGYPLPENMPFDYHCNAYGNNNNTTTNHNHNSSVHLNQSVGTGICKFSFKTFRLFCCFRLNFNLQNILLANSMLCTFYLWNCCSFLSKKCSFPFWMVIYWNRIKIAANLGHRRTPCVLTPPSTPINSDLSAMNVVNTVPAHLYTQSSYRATPNDFTNEKVSPMHYTSNASYAGHQTTAVDIYNDLYNGYSSCGGQSADFGTELPTMDLPNLYNVNSYGYESHKFNSTEHSAYFDSEKKFDIAGVDGSRNVCIQNGYMHYNNCWSPF